MTFKNYVCTICAQEFTRKYSALRHNRTLHQGRANIVRVLEYIVGRIRGETRWPIRCYLGRIDGVRRTAI